MTVLRLFNNVEKRFANGTFLISHDYRLILCSALTFDATATTKAGVTHTELGTANGYTANGQLLANPSIVEITPTSCGFTADTTNWTASGGAITAAYGLLLNDSVASDPPVAVVDFEGSRSVQSGFVLGFNWGTNGFIRWVRQTA